MIDFSKVTELRIPEGFVKQILVGEGLIWKSSTSYNLVPYAIDTDGSIYNDTGFMDGWRLNSSGVPTEYATACHIGYIRCVKGQIIRTIGNTGNIGNAGNTLSCYDSNFTFLSSQPIYYLGANTLKYTDDDGDGLYLCEIDTGNIDTAFFPENTVYIRISHGDCRGVNLIVTLEGAIPNTPTLVSISATYAGGEVEVGTPVTSLTGISVTATYSDGSTQNVTGYNLSGTVAEGSNTITVSYEGKTTTIIVIGVAVQSYTNLVPLSTEADGKTIYNNGLGYKDKARIRSGGAEAQYDYGACTGFIPFVKGEKLYIFPPFYGGNSENAINFADASFTNLGQITDSGVGYGICEGNPSAFKTKVENGVSVLDLSNNTISGVEKIAYVRITNSIIGHQSGISSGADMIITKNEEIPL